MNANDDLPIPMPETPTVRTFDDVLKLGVLAMDRFRQKYPEDFERLKREHFARFESPYR